MLCSVDDMAFFQPLARKFWTSLRIYVRCILHIANSYSKKSEGLIEANHCDFIKILKPYVFINAYICDLKKKFSSGLKKWFQKDRINFNCALNRVSPIIRKPSWKEGTGNQNYRFRLIIALWKFNLVNLSLNGHRKDLVRMNDSSCSRN